MKKAAERLTKGQAVGRKSRFFSHSGYWLVAVLLAALQFFLPIGAHAGVSHSVTVAVSIVPQKYFVDSIARGRIKTIVMVPIGANPHTYEPRPGQMVSLSSASAYLTIGIEFERAWLKKILAQNSHLKVFHMEKGIKGTARAGSVALRNPVRKTRGDTGKSIHSLEEPDPHIWLSPVLAKTIASNTARALISIDPGNREFYAQNLELFKKRIDKLHKKIKKILNGKKNCSFIVFHPAWGYFAQAYGLEEIPIESEGKEPGPKELRKIIEVARKKKIKAILVEPQFSDRIAGIIARAIGGRLIKVDPLAYNWDENLLHVAKVLEAVSR